MTTPPPTLSPISPFTRIHAIDAVRGFALLGIFLVNIQSFGEPFGEFIRPAPAPGESALDTAAFYFVKIFCEGKFYPLFSMLFGMGVALQYQRARSAGRPFLGTGLRRMAVLLAIGLTHALMFWYGDVLVMYSLAGVLLVFLVNLRIRTLVIIGAVFLMISVLLSTGFAALVASSQEAAGTAGAQAAPVFERVDDPFGRWLEAVQQDGKGGKGGKSGSENMSQGPASPLWVALETQAYREGPFYQVFMFRLCTWLMMIIIELIGFGWHILAMFFFGAALMKAGIFSEQGQRWRRRLVMLGLCVGVPMSAAAAFGPTIGTAGKIAGAPLMMLGGPLISLAYLGVISLLVDARRAGAVTRSLANVGRMAMTNYLTQTVIATTIFYYYGLGLFGETSRAARFGMVLGIYACQIAFSALWLRAFAYGPMEWMWRSLTYLRIQPMRKVTTDGE